MSHQHTPNCYGRQGAMIIGPLCGFAEDVSHAHMHESYLRIRQKLADYGAFRTNHGGENRFEVTEAALDVLLKEAVKHDAVQVEPLHILTLFHQMWGESIEGKYVKTNWIDLQTRLETLLATCAKDSA